jgi:dTDP-4-dehydrorhamnose reductase
MINVLVTGAGGQLGKTIKALFSKNNCNINFVFVTKEELDITNSESTHAFFLNNKFDYCINCAAYTNVEQAEKTPEIAFKVNAEGVKFLAKSCKISDTILIHISTDYVFDGEKSEPYTVDDIPNPINEYGKSKRKGEEHIQDILKKYFIIRTSWLYSKKHGRNFYKTILEKAKTKAELSVTTDQTGCPTDAVNLSNYIINLVKDTTVNYGIKHFCDEKEMTWFSFAEEILKENSLSNKVKLVEAKNYCTFARRPKKSVLTN